MAETNENTKLGTFGELAYPVKDLKESLNHWQGLGFKQTYTNDSPYPFAILDDGSVKCWGYNFSGQLGYGDITQRGDTSNEMGDNLPTVDLGTGRTAVQISCGGYHTCVILDDGTVKCWGINNYGQLGYGHITNIGIGSNQMGDNLPTVDLGTGRTAVQISLGKQIASHKLSGADVVTKGDCGNELHGVDESVSTTRFGLRTKILWVTE